MQQSALLPTTEQLLNDAASANPLNVRRRIEVNGMPLDMILQMDRILVYRGNEDKPFAILRFGGPHSGAIWIDGQFVGEYDKDGDGNFVVIEVESGFKQPESIRHEDPFAHLIRVGIPDIQR